MRSLATIVLLALGVGAIGALAWHAPGRDALFDLPSRAEAAGPDARGTGAEPAAADAEALEAARPASFADLFAPRDAAAPAPADARNRGNAGPDAGAAPPKRVYFQYVDASGNVHFVQRLEQVPPAYREAAGRVEVSGARRPAARSTPRGRPGPPSGRRPFSTPPDPTVVVYTAPWCGWCRKTLAHLDSRRVAYVNKDIEANPAHRDELVRKTGRSSIPVVEIDGHLIRGHDPARIDSLLF